MNPFAVSLRKQLLQNLDDSRKAESEVCRNDKPAEPLSDDTTQRLHLFYDWSLALRLSTQQVKATEERTANRCSRQQDGMIYSPAELPSGSGNWGAPQEMAGDFVGLRPTAAMGENLPTPDKARGQGVRLYAWLRRNEGIIATVDFSAQKAGKASASSIGTKFRSPSPITQ